jgi:hypothetical protein
MSSINVDWPTAPLSETQWRRRLEDLAERCEAAMLAPHETTLQDQATLAVHWLGLCWSGFSPATIAASCRGSLLVGENIVVAPAPCDQIAERLALIWQQADADADAAAVAVEVPAPMLELGPVPDHVPQTRRRKPKPEPEALEPAAPAPAAADAADLEAEHAVEALELELQPGLEELEPEPLDEPLPPPPADWLTAAETCELLNICRRTVCNWREAGRFHGEGEGFGHDGRQYLYNPDIVELLMADIPAGLDQLLSEVQAA